MKYLIVGLTFFQLQVAMAATIKCPTPPTAINPEIVAKDSFDKKTGLYKYQYTIYNKADVKVPIRQVAIKIYKPVENIKSPQFWKSKGYIEDKNKIFWNNSSLTPKLIESGQSLSGFEFTSSDPPGLVRFYAYGKPDGLPTAVLDTEEEGEVDVVCPGFFYDGDASDVTLVTTGPLPPNQVDVKLRMRKLKDKKWQGKHNDEAKLEVSPLDTDKVQVILFDDKNIDTSKINLSSLEFGFGKAKPTKTYFLKDFNDDCDDEIKEHVKKHKASHLVMEFNLVDVDVRCDVDRVLYLTGKIDSRNLFGAVKIKHSICDKKTFYKKEKKSNDHSKKHEH
ncbi:MAG: hypothetical protein AABY53_06950 [Bdellovibrionota bacterium]